MKKLLLIDGDEFLFRATAAVEHETKFNEVLDDVDWSEPPVHVLFSHPERAWDTLTDMMDRIFERFETQDHVLCFSAPPNFRFTVDPTYKNNRANSRKPLCYVELLERVKGHYKCKSFPGLEADDCMGIIATKPSSKQRIIVSQDKDMKTIPTTVWNGKDLMHISEAEADYWHMYQTLCGDTSDGYRGCPGIGKVKAEKLLTVAAEQGVPAWVVVRAQYEAKDLTEADALTQARLARILRWSDWDGENKQPILWTPSG